jgi:hypothetical protein
MEKTLLMYMMQPSRFNPMVQTPWSDHADFPDMENIGSFALYKNFTLFEIVNELVSKEEPLYFNPPNLARNIAQPKSKKRGTPDSKGMQQRIQVSFQIIHQFLSRN